MERGAVDLRTCKPGDILISAHGAVLVYIRSVNHKYFSHEVRFIHTPGHRYEPEIGTRTDDGFVFTVEQVREKEDHDIVLIIPRKLLQTEGILGGTE